MTRFCGSVSQTRHSSRFIEKCKVRHTLDLCICHLKSASNSSFLCAQFLSPLFFFFFFGSWCKLKWLSCWTVKRCVWAELLIENLGFLTRKWHLNPGRSDEIQWCFTFPCPVCGILCILSYPLFWAWGQFKASIWAWICIPTMISETARSTTEGLDLFVCQIIFCSSEGFMNNWW